MGISEAARDPADDEHRYFNGEGLLLFVELFAELFEVDAADQFHGNEENPLRFAQMIGLNDVGVNQVGDELRLSNEIIDELFLVGVILPNDLDGNSLHEIAGPKLLR